MKAWKAGLVFFLTVVVAFAVCGDRICEFESEVFTCRDCAMINSNGVCENYTGALTEHDPDCESNNGCYGPDPEWYVYDSGRGENCWPGKCVSGVCNSSCSDDESCTSGFCIDGECSTICPEANCSFSGTQTISPVYSAIYTGSATQVVFNVSGSGLVEIQVSGPCNHFYDPVVDLSSGTELVMVGIEECKFKGLGSIRLNTSDSSGVIHILSFPTLLQAVGDAPSSSTGRVSRACKLDGIPVEVEVWVG